MTVDRSFIRVFRMMWTARFGRWGERKRFATVKVPTYEKHIREIDGYEEIDRKLQKTNEKIWNPTNPFGIEMLASTALNCKQIRRKSCFIRMRFKIAMGWNARRFNRSAVASHQFSLFARFFLLFASFMVSLPLIIWNIAKFTWQPYKILVINLTIKLVLNTVFYSAPYLSD